MAAVTKEIAHENKPIDLGEAVASNLPAITLEDIWNALSQDQFVPYFQPKVALKGMELKGVEALIRWRHPQRGTLSAAAFLPLVQDNFLFDDLSTLMLEKSIAQCREWADQGMDVSISVNLSPDLLRDPALGDRVEALLQANRLSAGHLTLEVPEHALAYDLSDDLEALVKLRVRGFGLAIDDFGSGHCTHDLLERVPASELKLDRKMLAGAARRPMLRAQLEEALDIACELNFLTVAEGVENQEEWDLVNELGCDMAQGYFIARPMTGEALAQWHRLWTTEPFM
jgi:EAL domain-containing protein (putative c-di-GMP-specific phosphodiesterase class I)